MAIKPIEHVATILNACATDQIPAEQAKETLEQYFRNVTTALIKAYSTEDQQKSKILRNCLEVSDEAGLLDKEVYQSFRADFDGIEYLLRENGKWN
ncbi:MAG: hypothetical protein IPP74_13905 [Alphaproteobacteria bacterium]|nr:hypothetical protein [Alphaproteobacteria bacterium]